MAKREKKAPPAQVSGKAAELKTAGKIMKTIDAVDAGDKPTVIDMIRVGDVAFKAAAKARKVLGTLTDASRDAVVEMIGDGS